MILKIFIVLVIFFVLLLFLTRPKKTYNHAVVASMTNILKQGYINSKKNVNNMLNNFPIYYINLDRSVERYKSMEDQIKFYDIKNIYRISGVDGKALQDLYNGEIELSVGKIFKYENKCTKFLPTELGCTLSHLRVIHTAYTNGDQYAIIMEDDIGFGLMPFWEKNLLEIISDAPSNWQILSLWPNKKVCTANKGYLPYPAYICWGTACYVISRSGMEDVLRCIKGDTIFLHDPIQADLFIYLYATTYTYTKKPLFYLTTDKSTVVDEDLHIDVIDWEQSVRNINYYILDADNGIIKQCKSSEEIIPKIIHQTWKTKNLPESYKKWSNEIKIIHPDWEYKLWTDEDNRNFIFENYPWFLEVYDGYDQNIKRVDAVRYFLLYHYGGVYMDMDMTTLKKLDSLMKKGTAIFGYQLNNTEKDGAIANAFMACPPKHPLFELLIYGLKQSKNKQVLEATGPNYLTKTIRNYNDSDIKIYKMPIIYTHEWDSKDKDLAKCEQDMNYCREKYPLSYTITFWTGSWLGKPLLYKIPSNVTAKVESKPQLIPNKLVKILITDDDELPLVPEYLFNCIQSWIELNPEYDFSMLNKKDCLLFLKNNFPEKVVKAFNSLKPYAYKSDLVRICWLYIYGGVYSDFRMELLKPLKDIIKSDTFFYIPNDLVQTHCENPLVNGFIASVPKNPLLARIIENICDNVENKRYGKCSLDITGPVLVGNTVRSIIGGNGPFSPGIYTWNDNKYEILQFTPEFIKQNGEKIIKVKPKKNEFTTDISQGNVYWKMWQKKDIYI